MEDVGEDNSEESKKLKAKKAQKGNQSRKANNSDDTLSEMSEDEQQAAKNHEDEKYGHLKDELELRIGGGGNGNGAMDDDLNEVEETKRQSKKTSSFNGNKSRAQNG